ncbi:MAG: PD-(D/E)XK nuclease family transposase [Roseburia hominis]
MKAHVEQMFFLDSDFKSVRFDVYAPDAEAVSYDVEMQNDFGRDLPRRCRYYQAELDVSSLQPGEDYQQLKPGTLFSSVRSIRLEKEDTSMCSKSTARRQGFRLGMRRRRSFLIPMAQIGRI